MTFRTVLILSIALSLFGCGRKHIYSTPTDTAPRQTVTTDKNSSVTPVKTTEPKEITPEKKNVPVFTEASIQEAEVSQPAANSEAMRTKERKEPIAGQQAAVGEGLFYIQVGAFKDAIKSQAVLGTLMSEGYAGSRIVKDGTLYKVQAGNFADEAAATRAKNALLPEFPGSFLTR